VSFGYLTLTGSVLVFYHHDGSLLVITLNS
jgi:hypothetical protein